MRALGEVVGVFAVKAVVEVAAIFISCCVKTEVAVAAVVDVIAVVAVFRVGDVGGAQGVAGDEFFEFFEMLLRRIFGKFGNFCLIGLLCILFIEDAILFLPEMRAAKQIMSIHAVPTKRAVIEPGTVLEVHAVIRFIAVHALVEHFTIDTVVGVNTVNNSGPVKRVQTVLAVGAVKTEVTVP
jgi:hypothetical protein